MSEPGKTFSPIGNASSMASSRLKGAAFFCRVQSGSHEGRGRGWVRPRRGDSHARRVRREDTKRMISRRDPKGWTRREGKRSFGSWLNDCETLQKLAYWLEAIVIRSGDLFAGLATSSSEEEISILADSPGAKIERIVSNGQASPPGFWYDQDWTEWVFLISGETESYCRESGDRGGRHLPIPSTTWSTGSRHRRQTALGCRASDRPSAR